MEGEIIAKQKNKMTENEPTETNINQNKKVLINARDIQSGTNKNNTVKVDKLATSSIDTTAAPVKEKKITNK